MSRLEAQVISLTSQVSGILPLANGGTETALTDPSADRMMFWDNSASAMEWLTAGSNIAITGTSLDVTIPDSGLTLVSATSISGTNSGDITIEADKLYKIIISVVGSSSAQPGLRFNSANGASDYSYILNGKKFGTAAWDEETTTDDRIILTQTGNNLGSQGLYLVGELNTTDFSSTHRATLIAHTWVNKDMRIETFAMFIKNEAIANFEIFSTQNMTGTIYLWEYDLSI